VTEAGKPQARAQVTAEPVGSFAPADARTDAKGRFTIRKRISKTTTFEVDVPEQIGPCQGSSAAPGGCVTTTVSPVGLKRVRVAVPRTHRG
jgi:hypothetical protein